MDRIQVIAKNMNFPTAAARPPPAPASLCDKADCRALRWELKIRSSSYCGLNSQINLFNRKTVKQKLRGNRGF